MKNTMRLFVILTLTILGLSELNAQVKGLSYTLAPYVEKTWTNQASGLENGYLGGLQLGFGFGEYVELRANYSKSFGLNTDPNKMNLILSQELIDAYTLRNVDLTRWGGEMKFNLSSGKFLPYLTLGTGIQTITPEDLEKNKQIYVNGGLGIKFTAADRYTIGLQAINTGYRFNAVKSLLSEADQLAFNIDPETYDFSNDKMTNWSLRASVVFYIGGRKPGELTDIDKAYYKNFAGGFGGLSVPIEPLAGKIDFNEALGFRDTWMAGVSTGLNFGPLVGVRGHYWRALEEGSATKFDKLAIYGMEGRFKLNEGSGMTPYITIGGGYINAGDDYVGREGFIVEDKAYAAGGLGLDLPFSKYLKATAFARSILTSSSENLVDNIATPDDIATSWAYGLSLNFVIGKKPEKASVVQKNLFDGYQVSAAMEQEQAIDIVKNDYEERVAQLERDLSEAVDRNDAQAVKSIAQEKQATQNIINNLDDKTGTYQNAQGNPIYYNRPQEGSQIRMTPAEFQLIIRDLIDGLKKNDSSIPSTIMPSQGQSNSSNANVEDAIKDYDTQRKLDDQNTKLTELGRKLQSMEGLYDDMQKSNEMQFFRYEAKQKNLIDSYIDLKLEVERLRTQATLRGAAPINKLNTTGIGSDNAEVYNSIAQTNDRIDAFQKIVIDALEELSADQYDDNTEIEDEDYFESNRAAFEETDTAKPKGNILKGLQYKGMSGIAGFGVGGNATFNLGYRLHYGIAGSKLEFMPESFFGLGSPSKFGIMANLTYPISFLSKIPQVKPYIGIGAGLMKVGDDLDQDKLTGAWNFIVGSYFNVANGDVFVDYTARNLFSYNQVVVGYRFPF